MALKSELQNKAFRKIQLLSLSLRSPCINILIGLSFSFLNINCTQIFILCVFYTQNLLLLSFQIKEILFLYHVFSPCSIFYFIEDYFIAIDQNLPCFVALTIPLCGYNTVYSTFPLLMDIQIVSSLRYQRQSCNE